MIAARVAARSRYVLTTALTTLTAMTAHAQAKGVGHLPSESPYRDLRYGYNAPPFAGYLDGDGGRLGLGPHDGWMYGLRLQFRSNKFLSFGAQGAYGTVSRKLLDPDGFPDDFDLGEIDQNLWMVEGMLQINLTGNKTWHRLAPYGGLSLGAAIGSSEPRDSSGYNFGTKFMVTPYAGVRIMPVPRIGLRLEARAPFWKLSYPGNLRDPGDPEAAVEVSEWVASGFYTVGIVIGF